MKTSKYHLRPEFWLGIIFSVAALVHFLNKSDINIFLIVETYWPLVFVLLGIIQGFSRRYQDVSATVFLIATGVVLLMFKLDFFSSQFFQDSWLNNLGEFLKSLLGSRQPTTLNGIFSNTGVTS